MIKQKEGRSGSEQVLGTVYISHAEHASLVVGIVGELLTTWQVVFHRGHELTLDGMMCVFHLTPQIRRIFTCLCSRRCLS
jgi:hypothetical protein